MVTADRIIALGLMALSAYFMWHASALPIGWNGMTGGPGGGAFPFWLSAIIFVTAGLIILRSFRRPKDTGEPFFDQDTLRSVVLVVLALIVTVALLPFVGAYIAIPLFLLWYLKVFGGHGWGLTAIITLATPVFLFFFFEVTLKILLPKGWTEPFFIPLYARFF
ncbi:tripartite tricarboxylate transporter TctB family protein [Palleronia caenipelagi]|uniref:Tripartite tricarboxylate transporter TctB family protein n=1 Tax=Palleronia caenipelagi TaxID=2489174 RepID=A0A547PME4_9RHOB|nr:tripartite tricarboxylate transporter TctB family protein [Palleronia caenipelagi]TRD15319.1 tripartite tricarboxylate transporter TctB family protein [Palleronia caenipelagi]